MKITPRPRPVPKLIRRTDETRAVVYVRVNSPECNRSSARAQKEGKKEKTGLCSFGRVITRSRFLREKDKCSFCNSKIRKFPGRGGYISESTAASPHPLLYYIPSDLQEHNKFAVALARNSGDRYLIVEVLPRGSQAPRGDLNVEGGDLIFPDSSLRASRRDGENKTPRVRPLRHYARLQRKTLSRARARPAGDDKFDGVADERGA